MGTAIWFSRHPATPEQVAEIQGMGYTIEGDPMWAVLAARNLTSEKDVQEVVYHLREFARGAKPQVGINVERPVSDRAIFGVFAAPVQEACNVEQHPDHQRMLTPCFSAWNVMRTPEGGKPTFQHLRFCRTGQI